MTHYADTRTETSKDTMTKTHDFTPEFLQTPGLHLVRLGVLQRYVAQEDDQPVGVRAGDEFTVLRHNRNQPALPLTSEQELFLRDLDPSVGFNSGLLTVEQRDFVLALLRYGALLPVFATLDADQGTDALLAQFDILPVFRQGLKLVSIDNIALTRTMRPVEHLRAEDPDAEEFAEYDEYGNIDDEPGFIAESFVISTRALDLILTQMRLDNEAYDQFYAYGGSVPVLLATLAKGAEVQAQRLHNGAIPDGRHSDEILDAIRRQSFDAALEAIAVLTRYGAFSFEAREEVVA